MSLTLSTNYSNNLILNIYPTLACNFKCSYCYSYKNNKNTQMTKQEFLNLINEINQVKEKAFINFLGGEPTLYKYLPLIKNIESKHLINITTNGQYPEILLKLKDVKFELEVSLHYEYFNDEYFQNLKKLFPLNPTFIINISKKTFRYLKIIKKFLPKDAKISLNYLSGISPNLLLSKKLKEKIENEFKNYNTQDSTTYFLNNKKISFDKFKTIYDLGFKNWICNNNIIDIYKNKKVLSCTQQEIKELKIHNMQCPFKKCLINCYADTRKIKV